MTTKLSCRGRKLLTAARRLLDTVNSANPSASMHIRNLHHTIDAIAHTPPYLYLPSLPTNLTVRTHTFHPTSPNGLSFPAISQPRAARAKASVHAHRRPSALPHPSLSTPSSPLRLTNPVQCKESPPKSSSIPPLLSLLPFPVSHPVFHPPPPPPPLHTPTPPPPPPPPPPPSGRQADRQIRRAADKAEVRFARDETRRDSWSRAK